MWNMVSAPTAILGNKLPSYVQNIHNPAFFFFPRTLSTVADGSNMFSYINSALIIYIIYILYIYKYIKYIILYIINI